jgi:hypothetical protein
LVLQEPTSKIKYINRWDVDQEVAHQEDVAPEDVVN